MLSSDETWMTRREAAHHLRCSTRQLDRLRLPRSFLGERPRYAKSVLDSYLRSRNYTPGTNEQGGLVRPPRRRHRVGPVDWNKRFDDLRRQARLAARAHLRQAGRGT